MKDKIDVYDLYQASNDAGDALHKAASRLALHAAHDHGIDTDRVRVGYVWLGPRSHHTLVSVLVYVDMYGWKPIAATGLLDMSPHDWNCDDPTVLANIQVACKEAA